MSAMQAQKFEEITKFRFEATDGMKLIWDNWLELDFNEPRTDEWVEEKIRERL